jgi:hypothetical protein
MNRILFLFVAGALALAAASIDGKWVSQMEMRGRGENAEVRKVEMTIDLKSEGGKLTGSVSTATPRGNREQPISDGKIDGDKFSFTTVQKTQQGEAKISWSGTVAGDELKGERTREGANRGQPFTAKRK